MPREEDLYIDAELHQESNNTVFQDDENEKTPENTTSDPEIGDKRKLADPSSEDSSKKLKT